ncbi:MAG TPA: hypothetical protein VFZ17_06740 [Acidimicrobiia bacterium]|nr:hypothetical protein [Acidimicrobiia bacterium]
MGRRTRLPLFAPLLGLVVLTSGLVGTPAAVAATKDPCKVVTTSEISKAFGGATVAKGKAGLKTAVSAQCKYAVGATADLPAGDLVVHVMFIGGKAAYDGLKTNDLYVPTTGLSNSIYNERESVVNTLKGSVLLGMQGLFDDGSLPVTFQDVESQLVAATKAGLKRV